MKNIAFINSKGVLIQDDCLNVMAKIKSNSIDCIFADPPFNIKKSYHDTNYKDNMAKLQYEHWVEEWLQESVRIIKPGGSLFVYHMPSYLIKIAAFLNARPEMIFKNWIALSMKNGFPIKKKLHPAHYGLLYYVKNGAETTFNVVRTKVATCRNRKCNLLQKDYGGYRNKFKKYEDEDGVPWIQISDFWEDTRPVRHYKNRPVRINELPYEIPERAISLSTKKGDVVFDPFGGSGSTYFAACVNNRNWIGSEVGNCSYIIQRLLGFETNLMQTFPKKIMNVFHKRHGALKYTYCDEQKEKNSKVIETFLKENCIEKIKKQRYSHRMTNKVFKV